MKEKRSLKEYVVILNDSFHIKNVSLSYYKRLSLEDRLEKTKTLLSYLESIPSISMDSFKKPDGTYLDYITRSHLDQVIKDTYAGVTPATRPKLVPRMASEVCLDWISTLEKTKNNLLSSSLTSSEITIRDKQSVVLSTLIQDRKLQLLRHNLTTGAVRAALISDSIILRDVGLHTIADFAHKIGSHISLVAQLGRNDDRLSYINKNVNENSYSAIFESFLIDNLLKNPSERLLATMGEISKGLNLLLDDIKKKHLEERFIPYLKSEIELDQASWLKGVPKVLEFIDTVNPVDALALLRTILTTKPTNGFQLILIPYLVQKFYRPYAVTYNLSHQNPLKWVSVTQENYNKIVLIRNNNHRPATTIFNRLRDAKIKGFYRPSTRASMSSVDSNSTNDALSMKQGSLKSKIGSFTERAIQHGIPIGKGVSGTTNLYLGTIAHLIRDRDLDIDVNEALLGLTSFLIHDGGHSLHEALWTANQRESVAYSNNDELKYLKLGLNLRSGSPKPLKRVNDFIADYDHFFKLFNLNQTIDLSWQQTLAYFDKNNYFSGTFFLRQALKTLADKLNKLHEIDLKIELDKILTETKALLNNKSKLDIAIQLENLIENKDVLSFKNKDKLKAELHEVINYNRAQHKFLNTIKQHDEFKNFDKNAIGDLIANRHELEIDSSAFLNAFNNMLNSRNVKLSYNSLKDLFISYDINLGGAKLDKRVIRNRLGNDELIYDNYGLAEGSPAKIFIQNFIHEKYNQRIVKAVNDEQKLGVIARFIQDLSNIFKDETSRFLLENLLVNKLLLQNNLSPVILTNSERLGELSINRIKEEIYIGQDKFTSNIIEESTPVIESSSAKLSTNFVEDDFISDCDEYISQFSKEHAIVNQLAANDSERAIASLTQTQLIESYLTASKKLYIDNHLSSSWIPSIESIKESSKKGVYEVSFFEIKDTNLSIRKFETTDTAFIKIKNAIEKSTIPKKKPQLGYTLDQSKFRFSKPLAGAGLSLIFAANAFFSSHSNYENNVLPAGLMRALQLHYYVNLTSFGVGVAQDLILISVFGLKEVANPLGRLLIQNQVHTYINIAKAVGLNVKPVENALPRALSLFNSATNNTTVLIKPLLKLSTKVVIPIAIVLDTVSLAFDIYELTQVKTSQQKKISGAKVVVRSAGLGLITTGMIATAMGASKVANPLFWITIPLMVVGGGSVQVMQDYYSIEQFIEHNVVAYFDQVAKAYKEGYVYEDKSDFFAILSGAVVQKIDFDNGEITFGTQYLCERDQADKRRVSSNITNSISLRLALSDSSSVVIDTLAKSASIILLPDTPISYVSYNTANIMAFSKYKGPLYDNIHRIEKFSSGKFALESFSLLIQDNIICKLYHQYKPTEIDIHLDYLNRRLVVPKLPNQAAVVLNKKSTFLFSNQVTDFDNEGNNNHVFEKLSNVIIYNIIGKGGHYIIDLNEGAIINISTLVEPSSWILSCDNLEKDDVEIHEDQLIIGGVIVRVDPVKNSNSKITVIKKDGDVCTIDMNRKSSKIIQLDFYKWNKEHPTEHFDNHLKNLALQQSFLGEYIPIDNYIHYDKKSNRHLDVKRSYYDVRSKYMLFSKEAQIDGVLSFKVGNSVYFYNKDHKTVWQTDIATGTVMRQYIISELMGLVKDKMRLWSQNDEIYIAFEYTYNTGGIGELIFQLKENSIELVSYRIGMTKIEVFKKISPLNHYLGAEFDDSAYSQFEFPETKLISRLTLAPYITFYDKDNPSSYRYWLRSSNRTFIKFNLPNIPVERVLRLKLIGAIHKPHESEIFYFLDPIEELLYFQVGTGMSTEIQLVATSISGKFINAEIIGNDLFASTSEGLVYKIDQDISTALVAVNERWIAKHSESWISNLKNLDSSLMVLGLKNTDKHSALLAWYHDEQLVVADVENPDEIHFLGIYKGYARFFDSGRIKVYEQQVTDEKDLSIAFGDDHILDYSGFLEDVIDLFPEQKFKSASLEANHLRLITEEGVILNFDTDRNLNWVGVDAMWQLANLKLAESMELLAKKWNHKGAIKLENDKVAWYVFGVGKIEVVNDSLLFIGKVTDKNNTYVYFSDLDKKMLYSYEYTSVGNFIKQNIIPNIHVQRFDSSLLIQGVDKKWWSLEPLVLEGVTSIILSGKSEPDIYVIDKQARLYFQDIIIDNFSTQGGDDELEFVVSSHNELMLFCKGDDLVISDSYRSTLTIRNIFGIEKNNYNHLTLIVSDEMTIVEQHITDFINSRIVLNAKANLLVSSENNDLLEGGDDDEVYQFSVNSGHDNIQDSGGEKDTIRFILEQMDLNQFFLQRDHDDLVITYNNQQDSVTVSNHFFSNDNRIEYIHFDNGSLYDVNKLTQTAYGFANEANVWSYSLPSLVEY